MDSVSQAVLGASIGGVVLGKQLGRGALLGGALLGTLPDLDVLVDYGDAVENFTRHRGFSHSVLVLLPLSVVLAWLFHRWRPGVSVRHWFVFTSLILITHPLLDAFTTYGTQLLWPFGEPYGLASIFIIDSLYTLPLLAGCIVAVWRPPGIRPLAIGLGLSTSYLAWTLIGQNLITQRVIPTLVEQGLEGAPRLVQPMPFSTLLWRVTVMDESERLEIITGFLDDPTPLQIHRYPVDPELARAVIELPSGARLARFTEGFLSYDLSGDTLMATDVRLGLPGAHPFKFALASTDGEEWRPIDSYLLPRAEINPQAWRFLLQRTIGRLPLTNAGAQELEAPGFNMGTVESE